MQLKKETFLSQVRERYKSNNEKPVEISFRDLYVDFFGNNNKSNLHYIHSYPGKIIPYIPKLLLSLEELEYLDGYLLDPFAGSGTILLESITNEHLKRNSYGVDINPLARLISKVKTTPLEIESIIDYLLNIKETMKSTKINDLSVPNFTNINNWFSKNTSIKLSKLKYAINNLDSNRDIKDLFWLCFSNLIRKVSFADPLIPPPVYLKVEKYKENKDKFSKLAEFLENNKNPNVWKIFENESENNFSCIKELNNYDEICNSKISNKIIWDNANDIKIAKYQEKGLINKKNSTNLKNSSIELVITSPPYLTAQKYIRSNKLELFWLGYSEEEVNNLDKKSIGTERPNRIDNTDFNDCPEINSLIANTMKRNEIRSFQIHDYFTQMNDFFDFLYKKIKSEGFMFLILGDNKVLGERIPTYKFLTNLAVKNDFKEISIIKDQIKVHSMMTKRDKSGGLIRNEFIVILQK